MLWYYQKLWEILNIHKEDKSSNEIGQLLWL